jgi:pyrroline-5-carboxylate reductase
MRKIGFIGVGNMAGAILLGALNKKYLRDEDVIVYDVNNKQYDKFSNYNVMKARDEKDLINNSEIIFIGVKPQVLEKVVNPLKNDLKDKAVLSIVLGYNFEKYNELLDESTRHVFVMPNIPALVGEGMALIEKENSLTDNEFQFVKGLFEAVGEVEIIPSHLMQVGGALSGCGPAYIYMVIEALADGAVKNGMPRELAYKLASQTVLGSGKMQKETKIHPGILKDNVCSPGGSTIRGVQALETGNIRASFMNAVDAAMKKVR